MDKEDVARIHNGRLLNQRKNAVGLFVETGMDLESVIQSEVSQKDKKQISYVNAYVWNLEKWYR